MNPLVSVIVPVFNGANFVRSAIESVLAQTFTDFEVVVLDDASTDESADIVQSLRDPRIRLLRHPKNLGLVATLNDLVREARGMWLARQDHDDLSAPGRLERQLREARTSEDVVAVFSDARLISSNGGYRGRMRTPLDDLSVRWELCHRNPFPHTSAFLKRDAVVAEGGYSDLRSCEDYELWTRLLSRGTIRSVKDCLVQYRQHAGSIMAQEHGANSGLHRSVLRSVASEHLRRTFGVDPERFAPVLDCWHLGEAVSWPDYFGAQQELERLVRVGGAGSDGFRSVVADQDYTLFCRLWRRSKVDAWAFLSGLWRFSRERFLGLPWHRMGAMILAR